MKNVRVALIGVGNCASNFTQCIEAARAGMLDVGLSHPELGGYRVEDLEIVAAFDVAEDKVGRDLSLAATASSNLTTVYHQVKHQNLIVHPGVLGDGMSSQMLSLTPIHPAARETSFEAVQQELARKKVDVVVNYLPVGAVEASVGYAWAALAAKCAFINCTPALVANRADLAAAYARANLPLLGDDTKSQIGSTAVHQVLIKLLKERGLKLTKTYQLNIGGNSDFRNMRQPERGAVKKVTKERGLTAFTDDDTVVNVGPSDYVPQLEDHKVAYLHLEGFGLLGVPFSMDMQLKVEDSPNSTGVVLNAIRVAQVARDRDEGGVIDAVCPAFFKLPRQQVGHDYDSLQEFLNRKKVADEPGA